MYPVTDAQVVHGEGSLSGSMYSTRSLGGNKVTNVALCTQVNTSQKELYQLLTRLGCGMGPTRGGTSNLYMLCTHFYTEHTIALKLCNLYKAVMYMS